MTEKKPARLRRIKLDEISLVDRPANPHARITLFKREAEKESDEMNSIPASFATLGEAIAAIAKREGVSRSVAFEKAGRAHPDLVEKYNGQGAEIAKARAKPEAVKHFEEIIGDIARTEGLHRLQAMELAAKEFPEEFRRYQEA